ncbi:MAG: type VI secretion system tip protein VgrG [Polyangiaceae bacterium]|nr:type VI secretion system tip protein VgrG [Polyangiaceae bacterium]
MDERLELRHGRSDLELGTTSYGWAGFDVVRVHARERLSEPYEIDVTLMRKAELGPANLDELLDTPATLRVLSESRWRSVHGILSEVEEIDRTREAILYRVRLVPPLWRSKHRVRCRTFVDNTLEEIITTVLENRATVKGYAQQGLRRRAGNAQQAPASPSFDEFDAPNGGYRIAVTDPARTRDRALRGYVVQYNETDFDFLSRLLEEEGLTYYFEHEERQVVMTITDRPGFVPLFEGSHVIPFRGVAQGGGSRSKEAIQQLRRARRLRSASVTVADWDERRPQQPLEAVARARGAWASQLEQLAFPGRDEGNKSTPDQHPASVRLQRLDAERSMVDGRSTVRLLEPGSRFTMKDATGLREDEELIVVSVETFATQMLPDGFRLEDEPFGFSAGSQEIGGYENRLELLPAEIVFRPAMKTARPNVDGVHAAVVTADEAQGETPEIHCNEEGYVRLRFPWDQRREAGEPSSTWVRTSQGWAGAGFGMMYIPRVGQEVLVAYYQGDVERPVIVGRVYNAIQPIPYELPERKTVSTIKSHSSPGGDGFNEFRFEDKKGKEEIFLHAERNLNEVVKASHSESVGGDQSYGIGGNQTRRVGGNREVHVTGVHVMSHQSLLSNARDTHDFSSPQTRFDQEALFQVHSPHKTFKGLITTFDEAGMFKVTAGSATLTMGAGYIMMDNGAGSKIELVGGKILVSGDGSIEQTTKGVHSITGTAAVDIRSDGQVKEHGSEIRMND